MDRSDRFATVDLADVSERVIKLVARRLERQGVRLTIDLARDATFRVNMSVNPDENGWNPDTIYVDTPIPPDGSVGDKISGDVAVDLALQGNDMTAVLDVSPNTGQDAGGITIQQFNESAGGQVVFHTHVHVIPRHEGERLKPHTGEMADQEMLAAQAERIREALNAS